MFIYDFKVFHMIDRCTRWYEATVIPNREENTLCSTMQKLWIDRLGPMKELIMDQETGIQASSACGYMMASTKSDARINVRLPSELKQTIEEAASVLGQSVSEFTISTVIKEARRVIQDAEVTKLSNRDRDAFLAALADKDAAPNDALKQAARRYKK